MTDRTPAMLVCVYYRVAAADSQRVISTVREFQRTLQQGGRVDEVEVLLRCDLPSTASPASHPDAPPVSVPSLDPPAGRDARDPVGMDATVMETYRLSCAVAGANASAAMNTFLATLEVAAAPLAGLLRGTRHVELFVPCAS